MSAAATGGAYWDALMEVAKEFEAKRDAAREEFHRKTRGWRINLWVFFGYAGDDFRRWGIYNEAVCDVLYLLARGRR